MIYFFRKLPLVLSLAFLFSSCEKIEDIVTPTTVTPPDEEGITYIIKQGAHETTNPIKFVSKDTMVFEVKFDSTAIYRTVDPQNQADINKLYGRSDCQTMHHTNSARFGWRWYQDQLQLMAYSYANGKNTSTFITAIDLKKKYTCELILANGKYIFKVNDKIVEQPRGCTGTAQGYQLYPYFGGDEKAPHQVTILIREL